MKVLVTGGAGYIGSHTVVELCRSGHQPVVFDNFSGSSRAVCATLKHLCGYPLPVLEGDVRDPGAVARAFSADRFDAVIHFAGIKSVPESIRSPVDYYETNVCGTLNVLREALKVDVKKFVFSSSATVYGNDQLGAVDEESATRPTNPYGWSKYMGEQILRDAAKADTELRVGILRYFNPVGADESCLIGESPIGEPGNLMPLLTQVAAGLRPRLAIYGDDYPTPDGTGMRDFIHVTDLAAGHIATLRFLVATKGAHTFNLGTGRAHSVRQVLECFVRTTGVPVQAEMAPRRPGDVAACWANPSRAHSTLGWTATKSLEVMCASAWRWQSKLAAVQEQCR